MPVKQPLIITLSLDHASHDYFTRLRNQYYPRYCNYLEAHLTLFYCLPAGIPAMAEMLQRLLKRNVIDLQVTAVKNTNKGVIFTIDSEELQLLHMEMQSLFAKWLRGKDRERLSPHITIQNAVTAFKAQQTQEILMKDFKPFTIRGIGLATWLYQEGPWQPMHNYLFTTG